MKLIPTSNFNRELFENLSYDYDGFGLSNHEKVFQQLIDKKPYSITIILDHLDFKLWRRKAYATQRKIELVSRYHELIWEYFENEYGQYKCNEIYANWLKKYHNNGELIMKKELEAKYGGEAVKRFRNREKNMKPRFRIEYERLYNLPPPLNRVDWRNSFDNIFVWQDNDKKFCTRGGSGSSGARERNSSFIFGYALLNREIPIHSHLFLYNDYNQLFFLKSFSSLTVPELDIGSNYHLDYQEEKRILKKGVNLINWNLWGNLKELTIKTGGRESRKILKFQILSCSY